LRKVYSVLSQATITALDQKPMTTIACTANYCNRKWRLLLSQTSFKIIKSAYS